MQETCLFQRQPFRNNCLETLSSPYYFEQKRQMKIREKNMNRAIYIVARCLAAEILPLRTAGPIRPHEE
jgi:hypothetical protein